MALSKSYNMDLVLRIKNTEVECNYIAYIRQLILEKMEKLVKDCSSRIEEQFLFRESIEIQKHLGQNPSVLTGYHHEMMRLYRHVGERRERDYMTELTSIIQNGVRGQPLTNAQFMKLNNDVKSVPKSLSQRHMEFLYRHSNVYAVGDNYPICHHYMYELHNLEHKLVELMEGLHYHGLFKTTPDYEEILRFLQGVPYASYSWTSTRRVSSYVEDGSDPFDSDAQVR